MKSHRILSTNVTSDKARHKTFIQFPTRDRIIFAFYKKSKEGKVRHQRYTQPWAYLLQGGGIMINRYVQYRDV